MTFFINFFCSILCYNYFDVNLFMFEHLALLLQIIFFEYLPFTTTMNFVLLKKEFMYNGIKMIMSNIWSLLFFQWRKQFISLSFYDFVSAKFIYIIIMLDWTNKNISKKICENDITVTPAIIYLFWWACRYCTIVHDVCSNASSDLLT